MQAGERAKRSVVVLFLVFGLGAAAGCNKLKARDLLNRGVEDYKAGQVDQAIEQFKRAADLDPNLVTARLYLATAYASQFIPGAPSEENRRKGEQAIEEFRRVLDKDPNNLSAIDGIGSMLFNMGTTPYNPKLLEESKKYHLEHIRLAPNDPQPYYWVGVIDWTLAYRANREMREKYNANLPRRGKPIKEDEPLPASLREQFANQYQPMSGRRFCGRPMRWWIASRRSSRRKVCRRLPELPADPGPQAGACLPIPKPGSWRGGSWT